MMWTLLRTGTIVCSEPDCVYALENTVGLATEKCNRRANWLRHVHAISSRRGTVGTVSTTTTTTRRAQRCDGRDAMRCEARRGDLDSSIGWAVTARGSRRVAAQEPRPSAEAVIRSTQRLRLAGRITGANVPAHASTERAQAAATAAVCRRRPSCASSQRAFHAAGQRR